MGDELSECKACHLNKQVRQPVPKISTQVKRKYEIGELIHCDIEGPIQLGIGGYRYVAIFIDHSSKWTIGVFMKTKDELLSAFKSAQCSDRIWENYKIKIVHSDFGSEYTSHDFKDYLKEMKITQHMSAPYVHAQNHW